MTAYNLIACSNTSPEFIDCPEDFPLRQFCRTIEPAQADFLVFPWYFQDFAGWINQTQLSAPSPQLLASLRRRLYNLAEAAVIHNKPLLLFDYSDTGPPPPCPQAWIWRTSLDSHIRHSNEWALPAFHTDAGFKPPTWEKRPSVGFCGQAFPLKPGFRKWLGESARAFLHRPLPGPWGYRLRRDAMLSCLRAGPRLRCGFHLTDQNDYLPPDQQRQRFLANLHGHAYILCGSGYGNYSYRFYEALSAGCIPVLLNSNCVLPFEDRIPWKDLVVWVESDQIHRTAALIEAFHQRFNPATFLAHQRYLRQVWQTSCTRDGFQLQLSEWLCEYFP